LQHVIRHSEHSSRWRKFIDEIFEGGLAETGINLLSSSGEFGDGGTFMGKSLMGLD
jgi:hypothetical protein